MNTLENHLQKLNGGLYSKFLETLTEAEYLLSKYEINFPTYTDHSINHSKEVLKIASELLTKEEIENMNEDEIYVLMMACLLHDIGMCIPTEEIQKISLDHQKLYKHSSVYPIDEDLIRDIHHELSNEFINREYKNLKIPNEKYARAIGLVSLGHRKVPLDDQTLFPPKLFIKDGRSFICMPYLASILRLADELDITHKRTPKLLTKYYMPDNEKSIREWQKHLSTLQINYTEDKIIVEVSCSDHSGLAALEEQYDKISEVVKYCQKIIRTISNTEHRRFELSLNQVEQNYNYVGFDPKGIKFSFDVINVIKTFIGEDLYNTDLVALREAVQNSIDSCRYKKGLLGNIYSPVINITISENLIEISDNGQGMDEFIIENFFGRLGSSFYEQTKVKKEFEAIGQFGVGVFSYFLISEYIDIETKTENGKPIKFRIDKDPSSYFHFFDKSTRTTTGTTITLFLKPEKIKKYSISDYIEYLRNTFRHIEFHLEIRTNQNTIDLQNLEINLDIEEELKKRLKIQHKNKVKDFQPIRHRISNDDFDGECALLVGKFPKTDPFNLKTFFDYESFNTINSEHPFSQISISQKGVYVNSYSSDCLSFCIGQINLKNNRRININRREFYDSNDIYKVINIFNTELILKLFKEISQHYTPENLAKLSDSFLKHYFQHNYYNNNTTLSAESFKDTLIIELYERNESKFLNLGELKANYKTFLLISNIEDKNEIYNQLHIPVVIISGYNRYYGAFSTLFFILTKLYQYYPSIIVSDNKYYQKMAYKENSQSESIESKLIKNNIYEVGTWQEIESEKIAINFYAHKMVYKQKSIFLADAVILNTHHPFIKYLDENFEVLILEKDFAKLVRNIIQVLVSLRRKKNILKRDYNELNQLLEPFNKSDKIWTINCKDF